MAVVPVDQIKSMDYGFAGIPFCSLPLNSTVSLSPMDYGVQGAPFVVNYIVTAITTVSELPSEDILITDSYYPFNTTCILSESVNISDLLIGILLVAELSEDITISDSADAYNAVIKWIEDTNIVDDFRGYNIVVTLESEDIAIIDDHVYNMLYLDSITDDMDYGDGLTWGWPKQLSDNMQFTDNSLFLRWIFDSVSDSFLIYDSVGLTWIIVNTDTLDITDNINVILRVIIEELIYLLDQTNTSWTGTDTIQDTIRINDLINIFGQITGSISDSITLVDSLNTLTSILLLDLLGFDELISSIKSLISSIADNLNLTDEAIKGFLLSVEDLIDIVDTNNLLGLFFKSIQDTVDISDISSVIRNIQLSNIDSIYLYEEIFNNGSFYTSIQDLLHLDISINLNDDIWECYVLNTPKFHPSMYSNFNFNSFHVFENRAYGTNNSGIYELTGNLDADQPIHTGVVLKSTDFDSQNYKKFRRGYLGITGSAPVMVFETSDGTRQIYNITNQVVNVSSDLKSKSWTLSVAEFDELDNIQLIPVILTR